MNAPLPGHTVSNPNATAQALLSVDNVSLEYRTPQRVVRATHQVSFEIDPADRFVLLGPSGCGKSTLLKAAAGFIQPVEGEIRLQGQRVDAPGPDRIVVFQEFDQLPPWKTVKQNVMFPLLASRTLKKKEAEISIGDLKSNVKINRLQKISLSDAKKEKKSFAKRTGFDSNSKMLEYSPNLDIRGMRGEEILPLVQSFVDDGYMLGLKDLRIVHGKGNGILKEITRNLLRNMNPVAKMEDEHADRGGAGVTLVTLKA